MNLKPESEESQNVNQPNVVSRRWVLEKAIILASIATVGPALSNPVAALAESEKESPNAAPREIPQEERALTVTDSGVRFTDFREGTGQTPAWGDLLLIRYITYGLKEDGKDLETLDSSMGRRENYLMRHGNGFQIQGLEEAVHTMKVGGVRRAIIPPRLGFINSDVGPLPHPYKDRKRMNEVLNKGTGLIVMDIELMKIKKLTDNSQSYYTDLTPGPQELENMIKKMKEEGPLKSN